MNRALTPSLLLLTLPAQGGRLLNSPTLETYRDKARPLLIFAPNERDAEFQHELRALKTDEAALRERQVVVLVSLEEHGVAWRRDLDALLWPDLPGDAGLAARRRFGMKPGQFTVVLVGKDGGEKLTSRQPLSVATLESTIDAMPMRQTERNTSR